MPARCDDGIIEDPQYYVQIHQADPVKIKNDPKYWLTREARVLGNPSHQDNEGGYLSDEALEAEAREAVLRPEQKSSYLRLVLNVPEADTETPAVAMQDWYACGGPEDLRQAAFYDPELLIMRWGLKNRPCYLGLDLAWVTDFTGMSLVFPPQEEGEKWKLLFFAWLPEGRVPVVEKLTQQKIAKWVEQGFVLTVPGVRMSLLAVEEKIRWAARTFALQEVCYDPYGQVATLDGNSRGRRHHVRRDRPEDAIHDAADERVSRDAHGGRIRARE
jgi:phage terminase large subunit-like protein